VSEAAPMTGSSRTLDSDGLDILYVIGGVSSLTFAGCDSPSSTEFFVSFARARKDP